MASYLTPEWLMSDISQLVQKPKDARMLSESEFKKKTGGQHYDASFLDWWGDEYYLYGGQSYGEDLNAAYEQYKQDWGSLEGKIDIGKNIWDSDEMATGISASNAMSDIMSDPKTTSAKHRVQPPEGAYTEFTPEMFKKLRTEYYQPQIEEGRGTLLSRLSEKQRLSSAKGGALSGYGGREKASQVGQRQYYRGMEDIYSGIEEQKAQGLQDIYDVLGQYETITE